MEFIKKFLYLFFAGVILSSNLPYELFHHILVHHDDEVHVCDYSTCVSEVEHHCELDDQVLSQKFGITGESGIVFILPHIRFVESFSTKSVAQWTTSDLIRGPPFIA